ncbi:MAG TPA: hypothetical protein VIB39_21655 [Candidatus Angelobacter sp.]
MAENKTYSISVRLRRTTYEETFVSVPVTDALRQNTPDAQGRYFLDGAKVMEAAVGLGTGPDTNWRPEGTPVVEPHPVQTAPNDDPGDSGKIH